MEKTEDGRVLVSFAAADCARGCRMSLCDRRAVADFAATPGGQRLIAPRAS